MSDKETDKILRKHFEDVTVRNLESVILYGKDTRQVVRDLETKLLQYDDKFQKQDQTIQQLKKQLVMVQSIVFKGGTA